MRFYYALIIMVVLAAGEIYLRTQDPIKPGHRLLAQETIWLKSNDPELIYIHRPNYYYGKVRITEAHGILCTRDVSLKKSAGKYRIVVLGDSIAAGLSLRRGFMTPFPEKLEQLLKPHGEVLNFGVDGYGTIQEARLLETKALKFDPDLIILQYCMNDVGLSLAPGTYFMDPPFLYLYKLFRANLNYVPDQGPVGPKMTHYWQKLYDPNSRSWQNVLTGLARIAAAAKSKKIPVMMVIFPLMISKNNPINKFYAQVRSTGLNHGFTIVELSDQFYKAPLERVMDDLYHPGEAGHALAAQIMAAKITELFL